MFVRHTQLFLWKNSLQKARNPGQTCCELLTPVVLVALFALLYKYANLNETPDTTFECSPSHTTGVKYDFVYLPRALNVSVLKLAIVGTPGDGSRRDSFVSWLNQTYPGLPDPTGALLGSAGLGCAGLAFDVTLQGSPADFPPMAPFISTFDTEASMEAFINSASYGSSPATAGLWAAVVFPDVAGGSEPLGAVVRYTLRANASDVFDTHTLTAGLDRGANLGVLGNLSYSNAYSYGTASSSTGPLLAPLHQPGFLALQQAVDKFIIAGGVASPAPFVAELQDLLAFAADWGCVNISALAVPGSPATTAINKLLTSHAYAPQHASFVAFPISSYKNDDFYTFVGNVFALIFVLSFFFPSFFLIRGLVVEKETRIREGMRMMGLADAALFTAWYVTYAIIFFIIAFVIAVIVGNSFFPASNGALMLAFFFFFGLASLALCFLLSTFFSKAKLAAAVGAVLFIGAFFPYYSVNGPLKSYSAKFFSSLLAPVAFGLALDVVTTAEANGVGITWGNLYTPLQGQYSFGLALAFLLFDFALYTVLGLYLGNVLPSEYGLQLPWYYPVSPHYWRGGKSSGTGGGGAVRRGSGARAGGGVDSASLLPAAPGSSAAWTETLERLGLATGEAVEAPGPALRELATEGRCIALRGLTKTFPTPDGVQTAVAGVDLDMFEGQIFGLLGHNGAGKTTTISMLTGLVPPSAGDAFVNGASIASDMAAIRTSMGVCPQHDVLWDDLTVAEHLGFFAGVKGMAASAVPAAVMTMIREVGLVEKVDAKASELSGGQKRKLSVGIALIAGSKVVVLDEPTSGMDPWSRRFTWNVIQGNKAGRTILLTTHFLEEADILCDRISIMAKGAVRCCGSSMYLKGLFGVGYNLTVVKAPGCDSAALEAVVARHLGAAHAAGGAPPPYRVLSNVGAEMAFQIPFAGSPAFPALFRELEAAVVADGAAVPPASAAASVRIATYGVSVTTLEEVFLRVAEEGHAKTAAAEAEAAAAAKAAAGASGAPPAAAAPALAAAGGGTFKGGAGDTYRRSQASASRDIFARHFMALLCKRWRYALRDRRALLFQLLIPVVAMSAGLALLHQVTTATWPALPMSLAGFNPGIAPAAPTAAAANFVPWALGPYAADAALARSVAGGLANASALSGAQLLAVPLPYLVAANSFAGYNFFSAACNATDIGTAAVPASVLAGLAFPNYDLNATWLLSQYLLASKDGAAPWLAPGAAPAQHGASRYGALLFNRLEREAAGGALFAAYTAFVNTSAYYAAPAMASAVHGALLDVAQGGFGASIATTAAPLPLTPRQGVVINSVLSFVAVLFIVIAYAFVPASFAVFIVKEAEVKAKHQQLISGVSMPAYWLATYAWDIINYTVPAVAGIVLVAAFNITELVGSSLPATALLIVAYGLAVAPFTYVCAYAFKSHSTAQVLTLMLNLLCVILLLASFIMQQIPATCVADSYLRYFYRLLPGYSLGNGLIQLSLLKVLPFTESDCGRMPFLQRIEQHFTPLSLKAAGWPVLYLLTEAVVYFGLAILIDILLSYPVIKARLLPDRDVVDKPYDEDGDVAAEVARVNAGGAGRDAISLRRVRKVYAGGKVAVRDLSFGVPRGEVFGFLGINGAGKTTTLKILSGDEIPTRGTASLGGFDILTQQIEVRRLLGYCPQFDALLDLLTVREHLELYARIKGVPEAMLPAVVGDKLSEMDLLGYAGKLAGNLSGGNKRKLSVAIAMIGDPELIFLDEPSTGMDPVARRFMWNIISRIATERAQCSIILTTHSMEECEALANRVGIMVGGRLRCLGTTQHLKDKFGRGYLAQLKLRAPTAAKVADVLRYLQPHVLVPPAGSATASAAAGAAVLPQAALDTACAAMGDPSRARMLHPNGSGWALAAVMAREGAVDARLFAEWWAGESYAASLYAFILATFPGSDLLERHGEFFTYRIRVDAAATKLSALFATFEARKDDLSIAEYSLSQTSLEQIFNGFAAQQEEEAGPLRGTAERPAAALALGAIADAAAAPPPAASGRGIN